ncbi:MAG: ABC-type Fe3+/spermidine/putrescine transport system ATPase subunit [Desulforhopalus sp.]|jgi:ABC-type Fe3+/spermidine/putrescine transport system ATPase subunit
MVTHGFNEAFYLGDLVGIISKGRIKQVGIVDDVFLRPKNVDVGKFVGMKNIFQVGDVPLSIDNLTIGGNNGSLNGPVVIGLRMSK